MITINGVEYCTGAYAAKLFGIKPGSLRNGRAGGWYRLRVAEVLAGANLYRLADVLAEVERRSNAR